MVSDPGPAAAALFELDPQAVRCPYPIFAELRDHAPVMWVDQLEAFVVTRYDLITEVLRQPELFSSRNTTGPITDRQLKALLLDLVAHSPEVRSITEGRRASRGTPVLVMADPPAHTRQRAIVNRAFSPAAVRALEPQICDLAKSLSRQFEDRGQVELVSEFAVPLPMTVIATALGVSLDRMDDFKRWSDGVVGGVGQNHMGPEELELIIRTRSDLDDYLLEVIAERETQPREDLVSRIVHAEVDGERLARHEAVDMIVQFLVAGNETTAKLITATMLHLSREPELADRLRRTPEEIPSLIEEVLRLEPPSSGLYRIATADYVLGDTTIPAGSALWLVYAAGNRDESQFEAPDECRIGRQLPSPHLGFGLGAHFCLGAGLARAESRIGVETLLSRFRTIELEIPVAEIEYEPSYMVHGIRRLPLKVKR